MRFGTFLVAAVASSCGMATALGAGAPAPSRAMVDLRNYRFADGETIPNLKLSYLTLGTPRRDKDGRITNAVLLLHGTTGTGANFLASSYADSLYGAGQPFDLSRTFLIMPDGIGAGDSSKPSDGLRAHFPRYGYTDQVATQHAVLETIGVKHLKLVLGTSMGGMQAWLWAETYPKDADGFVAIASTPTQISGRNMMWREMISQAIRDDPDWKGGDYAKDKPPRDWIRAAIPLFSIMTGNAEDLQREAPTRAKAVDLVNDLERKAGARDPNDFLYQFESSYDYDPAPRIATITAPMLTINFADDLLNPPELLHLPSASNFTEVLMPAGPQSHGHQTLAHAEHWSPVLRSFLAKVPGWS
jgi:homoserine O-acetyltransferase